MSYGYILSHILMEVQNASYLFSQPLYFDKKRDIMDLLLMTRPLKGAVGEKMEKINVYVPENIGTMLENDAVMFEVYKNDGRTVNKNKFLGRLITGYYDDYVIEARTAYDKIMSDIDTEKLSIKEKEQIADSILRNVVLPEVPSRKGKNPARLSLKPTKDTEGLIEQIMMDLGDKDYISQYFCRMFMSYCEKPFSEREQIIFKDNYETLRMSCAAKRSIAFKTIWNPKTIHEVIPYKVVTGSEEMFNYLICAEINPISGQQEAKTYRLNRIDKINYGKSMGSIDSSVLHYLGMMVKYGPQYMINDEEESCVRLTESGRRNFSRIYYGRPLVDYVDERDDGFYYYFKGSKDQVFFYFRRFGYDDAEIISPESLRKRMIEFHSKAYEMYKGR